MIPKVGVVAGAASGVGLATIKLMHEPGTRLVGVDLRDRPAELAGLKHLEWVRGDIGAQATWDEVSRVVTSLDPAGASWLISCAAKIVVSKFLDTTPDDWQRLFETNVVGVIRGMSTLMPAMIERGDGAVAVVCSVNSFYAEELMSAYSTSKAALLHVVRSAALEHARHGLRINAVCPGAIDTPLLAQHLGTLEDPAAARQAIERRTPVSRILRPEEIATTLRFLVSEDASGLSGAAVVVDGGLTTAYDFDVEAG